jgi:hypothetical protein
MVSLKFFIDIIFPAALWSPAPTQYLARTAWTFCKTDVFAVAGNRIVQPVVYSLHRLFYLILLLAKFLFYCIICIQKICLKLLKKTRQWICTCYIYSRLWRHFGVSYAKNSSDARLVRRCAITSVRSSPSLHKSAGFLHAYKGTPNKMPVTSWLFL